jgi:hypothetical protein
MRVVLCVNRAVLIARKQKKRHVVVRNGLPASDRNCQFLPIGDGASLGIQDMTAWERITVLYTVTFHSRIFSIHIQEENKMTNINHLTGIL